MPYVDGRSVLRWYVALKRGVPFEQERSVLNVPFPVEDLFTVESKRVVKTSVLYRFYSFRFQQISNEGFN